MTTMVGVFTCIFTVVLDIISGILGIVAEAAQNQENHMRLLLFECKDPSPEAFRLGVFAAIILCMAHVVANLVGGCSFCTHEEIRKSPPSKKCSLACLFLTWVIFAIGLALLVIGTKSNDISRPTCGFRHHNYLSLGGILCFVHAGFSVGYYVTAFTR